MAARVMLLVLLLLVAVGCLNVSHVIVVMSEPAGTPIIIPQIIVIEPQQIPPFMPDFAATMIATAMPEYPFATSQPVVTQDLGFATQTPQPEITPSNLPPHMGGS